MKLATHLYIVPRSRMVELVCAKYKLNVVMGFAYSRISDRFGNRAVQKYLENLLMEFKALQTKKKLFDNK
jgi:hypothetical protein